MSFDLLLDSSLATLQREGVRNVSHDFTVKFNPPIELGSGNYKAALNRLITMSYLMVQHRCLLRQQQNSLEKEN